MVIIDFHFVVRRTHSNGKKQMKKTTRTLTNDSTIEMENWIYIYN